MKHSSGWIIPALVLGTFSLLLYGYNEHQIRSAAMANLQMQNVTAVHNMAYDIDEMQDALAKALLTSQPQMTTIQLQSAARYAARADVDTMHMQGDAKQTSDIQSFLNRVMVKVDVLTCSKRPGLLSSNDLQEIRSLANAATALEHHVRSAQASLLSSPMLVVSHGQSSHLPKTAFVSLGSSSASLTQILRAEPVSSKSYPKTSTISGDAISARKAISLARQYFHIPSSVGAQVSRFGPAYDDHGYMISFGTKGNDGYDSMTVGVSLHAGKVLWMHKTSASGTVLITPAKAMQIATMFLQHHDLSHLVLDQSDHYGTVSVYRFVPVVHDVYDTTRPVLVQVNRVNAQIVGLDASPYYLQSGDYVQRGAQVTPMTVRSGFRPSFKVETMSLSWKILGSHATR